MYYNGYGERICKQSIVNKLPFIFTSINGKNIINTANGTSINCFEDIPDIPMPTMNRNW